MEPVVVHAHPRDQTSVNLVWVTPCPLERTIGYEVYYTGPSNGSVVADEFAGQTNSKTVTGLTNGGIYNFSVAGASKHFNGDRVIAVDGPVSLCKYTAM